jgi:hypothetical protein
MPLHHYLPATFLASFSAETTLPRRERTIAVGSKTDGRVFRTGINNVAGVRDLYTLRAGQSDPQQLERLWRAYEDDLAAALEALAACTVDAQTWARVLVPFVAAMLVRGPDFDARFQARLGPLAAVGPDNPDNTNGARLLELQRLLGPVAAARWVVMEVRGEGGLITNDVGFTGFRSPGGEPGVTIPISPRTALGVTPRRTGTVAVARDGRWWPAIERVTLDPDNHHGLNRQLAAEARRLVFGPDEAAASGCLAAAAGVTRPILEPGDLGFPPPRLARVHEFLWHRLACVLSKAPGDSTDGDFPLDLEALASGWVPPIFFPTNLPEFPAGLRRVGAEVHADLYEVIGFTDTDPALAKVPRGAAWGRARTRRP